MIVSIWRYRVLEGHEAEFERIYGPAGEWAQLFGRAAGYLGTELLRGGDSEYVTIDRWRDQASWDGFKAALGDEYLALDARCEALTVDEQALGLFEQAGG